MLTEIRAYHLREQTGLTQAQLAGRIGVGQCRVSKVERGDLEEDSKIGTIRLYLEAVGGHLSIEYVTDDQRNPGFSPQSHIPAAPTVRSGR